VFTPWVRGRELVTERGTQALPPFVPSRDVYLEASFGAPNGMLCVAHMRRGSVLTFMRVGAEPPIARHVSGTSSCLCGAFDATGERFAALVFVFDEATRMILCDTMTGHVVADTRCDFDWIHLGWDGSTPYVYDDDGIHRLDAGGNFVSEPAPRAPNFRRWRHYGFGDPFYNPVPGRVAWFMCAEFPDDNLDDPGTSLIGWNDNRGGGTVAVRDHGWAREHRTDSAFATTCVLDDGRIVAVGTRIWLVDPTDGRVSDLGPAGDYPELLPIFDGKLWSRGPGPLWTILPP
jgi:hypothetical protein